MSTQRVVLITGASSGVGQSTARLLSQRGDKVFGTSRNPASAGSIPGVEMLSLDVRADASVRACIDDVVNRGGRLDVLIDNADYELAAALEDRWQQRALNAIRASEDKAPGPELVANRLFEITSSKTPRLCYLIGRQAKSVARLRRFLHAGMFEQGVRRSFALDRSQMRNGVGQLSDDEGDGWNPATFVTPAVPIAGARSIS